MDTNSQSQGTGGEPPRSHRMLPVWFFIGLILAVYGVMIFIEGLFEFSNLPDTVLANSHSPIWWGAIMAAVGVIFTVKNRRPSAGGH